VNGCVITLVLVTVSGIWCAYDVCVCDRV